MKPPRPATARQSGPENSVCNKHSSEVFISPLRHKFGGVRGWVGALGSQRSGFWTISFSFPAQKTRRARTNNLPKYKVKRRAVTLTHLQPRDAADYSSSTFHAGHHACFKRQRRRRCTRTGDPPLLHIRRALIRRAHVNLTWTTPITRQKQSISDIGWVGESRGGVDNTDDISQRQQRRRFPARGWLGTRRLLWHADLRRLNRGGCHRWQMMTASADRGRWDLGVFVCVRIRAAVLMQNTATLCSHTHGNNQSYTHKHTHTVRAHSRQVRPVPGSDWFKLKSNAAVVMNKNERHK